MFAFYGGHTLLPFPLEWTRLEWFRYREVAWLRRLGKDVLCVMQGCDLRYFVPEAGRVSAACVHSSTRTARGPSAQSRLSAKRRLFAVCSRV